MAAEFGLLGRGNLTISLPNKLKLDREAQGRLDRFVMRQSSADRTRDATADNDAASSDDDGLPACMPNPESLARLATYADRLPGAAALIATAS